MCLWDITTIRSLQPPTAACLCPRLWAWAPDFSQGLRTHSLLVSEYGSLLTFPQRRHQAPQTSSPSVQLPSLHWVTLS